MLSLSRVNISYMCLNMSSPKDFSGNFLVLHIGTGFQVCMGHRHEHGETE